MSYIFRNVGVRQHFAGNRQIYCLSIQISKVISNFQQNSRTVQESWLVADKSEFTMREIAKTIKSNKYLSANGPFGAGSAPLPPCEWGQKV
jgi:hypothetical protein